MTQNRNAQTYFYDLHQLLPVAESSGTGRIGTVRKETGMYR